MRSLERGGGGHERERERERVEGGTKRGVREMEEGKRKRERKEKGEKRGREKGKEIYFCKGHGRWSLEEESRKIGILKVLDVQGRLSI